MAFTDNKIKTLKTKAQRYEVWEGNGFGVRITPRGQKSWVWLYHFDGRPRRMTFGKYPGMGLADARIALADAQKQLDHGIDPGAALVDQRKAERDADTVSDLISDYIEKWAKPNKRSWVEDERILRKDVEPDWGRRKAADIVRRDVIKLLDSIVDRGAPIQANQTLAVIRKMYNWAISRDIVQASPCYMVKAPGKKKQRDRVLTPAETEILWNNLAQAKMSDSIRFALKLQFATAQRKGEVIGAEWSEIDFDEQIWTIPPEKAKNGLAHRVPLSQIALELLKQINSVAGDSRWLFPSPHGDKPITGPAVDHAMRNNKEYLELENVTPHDLRRTAASYMTSMGINRLTVSKILNHAESGVTAVYDRHSYDNEKREALDAWGLRLSKLIVGKQESEGIQQGDPDTR
ncbi:MAG: tyrosine-type recombinase/integrase [Alphaproteobacteria bacterium]|nr:tyrosine-type recombinase/integrase [Alphaproteobacteria bacterium]